MRMTKLKRRLEVLKKLMKVPKKQRTEHLKKCSEEEIHTICEGCLNILNNDLQLSSKQLKKVKRLLTPVKNNVRTLSKPKVAISRKRQILSHQQTGSGIFSVLAGVVIPAIISAISR